MSPGFAAVTAACSAPGPVRDVGAALGVLGVDGSMIPVRPPQVTQSAEIAATEVEPGQAKMLADHVADAVPHFDVMSRRSW